MTKKIAQKYEWISAIQRKKEPGTYDESFRAFMFGVDALKSDWDYLVKLDADTLLPPKHLESLVEKFEADESLGLASGVCAGEPGIASHPRGNNRMYRRQCWKEISFPEDGWGWDTIDEVFARLNGWKAEAFDEIICKHLRTKLPDAKYRFHQGRLSRHLGYYWWFVLGRSAKMLTSSGILPCFAYFSGYLRGGFGDVDEGVRRAVRMDQKRRIAQVLGFGTGGIVRQTPYTPRFDDTDPLITLGMPTLNRAVYLSRVLDGLYGSNYPRKRIRLVFVDGFSRDGTYKMLQDFAEQHGREYDDLVLIQDKGNIPAARNRCIQNLGNARLLLFLDSDVLVTTDFIGRLLGLMKAADISSIFYFSYGKPKPVVKYVHTVGMGCTLIKKDVLDKVGSFDTTLPVNEDTDYCLRAGKLGYKLVQDNSTQFLHLDEGRYSPEQTVRKSIRYRRGYAKVFRMGIYRNRFILYATLDLTVALGFIVHPWFFAGIIAYFTVQLVRRRSVKLAFYLTVNSLILGPLTMIGLLERRFGTQTQPKR